MLFCGEFIIDQASIWEVEDGNLNMSRSVQIVRKAPE
jgi:hypothetical protein